ncbi:MAG TPA: hypothetical protein VF904_06745 [Anaeromyxobacteraceae bacterium]
MSANARAQVVGSKHLCDCSRRATYATRMRQRRRARTDHPLCERCWRSLADRYRPAPAAPRWLPDELLARVLSGAAARPANAPSAA